MPRENIRRVLIGEVKKLYHEKEIEFPVAVAMARFMDDKGAGGSIGQKYILRDTASQSMVTVTITARSGTLPPAQKIVSGAQSSANERPTFTLNSIGNVFATPSAGIRQISQFPDRFELK
jgi:hypothetical protein